MSERGRSRLVAVAALGVASASMVAITAGGLGKNLVYYWAPSELLASVERARGATIRLGGQVAPGSLHFEPGASSLQFAVTDGANQVQVHARGLPPAMFREGIGVVVEGSLDSAGTFQSSRLMVSHGNEYRAPKPGQKVDVRSLARTVNEGAEPNG